MDDRILCGKISEGSYWRAFAASLLFHASLFAAAMFLPGLLPETEIIVLGSGPGGGQGGQVIPVGLAEDLSGGYGMIKPSLRPQPPAVELPKEKPSEPEKSVKLPELESSKRKPKAKERPIKEPAKVPENYVPVPSGPGSGGLGGSSGSGGGFGGGYGVAIGPGSGGLGDSWYARQVERRIGQNWLKTLIGNVSGQYQAIISFYIRDDGTIYDIRLDKSSGLQALDLSAMRAIEASNPLAPLPYEFRGKRVRFVAHFDYPPPFLIQR